MRMSMSPIDVRRLLAYREGECSMLISELRDELALGIDAEVAIGPTEDPVVV